MAKAETEKEENENEGGGSNKMLIIILVVLVLVVLGVGGALFMMMNKGDEKPAEGEDAATEQVEAPKTPIYVPLTPAFLANFEDQSSASYLQADVQVLTYDPAVEEAIKLHMPKIRNDLLLLFSSQSFEELNTVKGKRALSKKAAETVSNVLKDAGSPSSVDAVLFTSFVMQ